jgi:hypothetical protein
MIWLVLIWFTGAGWIFLLGNVAWSLLRKPPRSPAQGARLFGRVLLPVTGMLLFLSLLGQQTGWLHAGAETTLRWTTLPFVIGALVWSFGGERRLLAVLAARAAARQGQSE